MTAYATATKAIVDRLIAQWNTTPIVISNTDYAAVEGTSFVHCHVHWSGADQVAFGDTQNRFRHEGEILIEILTPSDSGPGLGLEYADSIAAIFRAKSFGGVECMAAQVTGSSKAGPLGNFWNTILIIPFYFDQRF